MTERRRLYLLRHAKSSWKEPGLADHDRPLAGRGRRAAKAIAEHLREHDIEPELVLCSTAKRARETLERIGLANARVEIESDLYAARADTLLARLRKIPPHVRSVMVIGHNPGLQELAVLLVRDGHELETKFPTGALATLALDDDWDALDRRGAELIDFIRPRDLEP